MIHTKTRNNIDFSRVVPIGLLVKVDSLKLILFLLIKVSHFCENFTIAWYFGYQDIVPLESLSSHTNKLVNMGNLVNDFITIGNDSMKFLKCLKRFVIISKSFVDEP